MTVRLLLCWQYESQDAQELRMIFEGQTFIHDTIRQLHQKLDEMMGRQEMTLSQVNNIQRQQGTGAGMPAHQGGAQVTDMYEIMQL